MLAGYYRTIDFMEFPLIGFFMGCQRVYYAFEFLLVCFGYYYTRFYHLQNDQWSINVTSDISWDNVFQTQVMSDYSIVCDTCPTTTTTVCDTFWALYNYPSIPDYTRTFPFLLVKFELHQCM